MQSITKFTEVTAAKLDRNTGIDHRREVMKRLGLNVELSRQGDRKYADAVFSLPTIPNAEGHATYSVFLISEN